MPDTSSFDALIERFIAERLTADELPVFFSFLEEEGFRLRYAERIDLDFLGEAWTGWSNEKQASRLYNQILQAGRIPVSETLSGTAIFEQQKVHRIHSILHSTLFRYSAAVLVILCGVGIYRHTSSRQPQKNIVRAEVKPIVPDIAPGGNKAVLILGDHSVVELDSLATGSTLIQGGMRIVKSANGEILYTAANGEETNSEAVFNNTMKTPRGGQYQLALPDGTQVWLNAASSITYPTRFIGDQRNVSISGEVYFDVAQNKEKPFVVNVNNHTRVEVLGTGFNINAYADEANVKTTLLEGKVRITGDNNSVTLLPGQQLAGNQVNTDVAVTQVMAWKNGVFTFEGKSLQQVLRELARWYDLSIIYEKDIPDIKLRGEMGMNLQLSQVIKGLEAMEVKCRLEPGRKLIISQ